jgi:hypothetical protein
VGEPDQLMVRNGEIVAIVEERGNWTLRSDDIANDNSTRASASAVNQLYRYMRLNHIKYGVITSYENTWFVYQSQECSLCDDAQGHGTLYVSEGIPHTAQNPSVLQYFSYFNSIVNDDRATLSTSTCCSKANTVTQLTSPAEPQSSSFRERRYLWHDFDVDDFKLKTVLGEGRSKVYLDHYKSQPIALKTADIAKNREMLHYQNYRMKFQCMKNYRNCKERLFPDLFVMVMWKTFYIVSAYLSVGLLGT